MKVFPRRLRNIVAALSNGARHPGRLVRLARLMAARRRAADTVPVLPVFMDVEPVARCNFQCPMCQVTTWDRKVDDLSPGDFDRILDSIGGDQIKLKMQGMGEPLLNKAFPDLVARASARGIDVETFTNASLLTEAMAKRLIETGIAGVRISVDGGTEETFHKIRYPGTLAKTVEGVKRLVAARGTHKHPHIGFWTVGQKDNLKEVPRIVEIAAECGVDSMTLQVDMTAWGKSDYERSLAGVAARWQPELVATVKAAEETAKRVGVTFDTYEQNLLAPPKGPEGAHASDGGAVKPRLCSWPWTSAYVTAEGFVSPCCLVADPRTLNFGNVLEKPFAEIWNSPDYQAFRRAHREGNIPPVCRVCYGLAATPDSAQAPAPLVQIGK